MKKRIFITGGNGFLGSAITDKLVKNGHEVASYDLDVTFINNPSYHKRCLKLRGRVYKKPHRVFGGDIRDSDVLSKSVKDFKPNIIVHLAGFPMARPLPQFMDQMIPINLYGTLNVLKIFEESETDKFVYTSSSMAYGHFKQNPQNENFILDPQNTYGACKAAGEYFVKLSKKQWSIVRPTSVYGFADCANRVSQLLIDAAYLKKKPWVVKGESLDFSYIDDVADGFVKVIMSPQAHGHTFNISAGVSRLATEFAEIIKGHFPDFEYDVVNPDAQQVYRGSMDIHHANSILNYAPEHTLEDGIMKTLELIDEYQFYKDL